MSKPLRTLLTAVAATVSLACLAAPAMAQAAHPRIAEINARLDHQEARIRRAVETGRMNRRQAARLHRAVERLRDREERMAAMHGGHLTAGDQARLNREADELGRRIGR
jgi:hypothetical protein